MLPSWFLLSLGGVMFAVGGILFDKYLLEKYFKSNDDAGPGALLIFSAYFLIAVVISVFIFRFSVIDFSLLTGLTGLLVGLLNGLWILLYLVALSRVDISRVVPIFQTIPIFGLVLGFIVFGEYLTIGQVIAASTILSGALILMHSKDGDGSRVDWGTLFICLASAFIVALSHVIFKVVAVDANYWTAAFWLGSGFVLFGVFLFFFNNTYREQFLTLFKERIANVLGVNSVNELFDNAGELIFLAAVVIGPIALVQSINAYEPVLVFICSAILATLFPTYFYEDLSRGAVLQKTFGIIVVLGGSLLLYTVI